MVKIKWRELFPNNLSIIIFILYILLFVNHGILVTASQTSNNEYKYDIATVVLLTEALKLLISTSLYYKNHTFVSLFHNLVKSKTVLGLYLIPAFLYCLYNNLAFMNLSVFDPTTYNLILQIRVVITALLFQVIFSKRLSKIQWLSLVLLTFGCMVKQVDIFESEKDIKVQKSFHLNFDVHAIYLCVQVFCSCFAGVYNEYLLKEPGANVDIYIQNIYMYLDSILCNTLLILLQGNFFNVLSAENLKSVFEFKVLLVMINNAIVGIITSFFLKTLNSILKTFASALELVLTAVFCYLLLGIPIYLNTILSIFIVMIAVVLYSQNPVLNVTEPNKKRGENENEILKEIV